MPKDDARIDGPQKHRGPEAACEARTGPAQGTGAALKIPRTTCGICRQSFRIQPKPQGAKWGTCTMPNCGRRSWDSTRRVAGKNIAIVGVWPTDSIPHYGKAT